MVPPLSAAGPLPMAVFSSDSPNFTHNKCGCAGPDGKILRKDSLDSNMDATTVADSVLDSQELDENDAIDDDIDEDEEAEAEANASEGIRGAITPPSK